MFQKPAIFLHKSTPGRASSPGRTTWAAPQRPSGDLWASQGLSARVDFGPTVQLPTTAWGATMGVLGRHRSSTKTPVDIRLRGPEDTVRMYHYPR
jgi:hypothetical protein